MSTETLASTVGQLSELLAKVRPEIKAEDCDGLFAAIADSLIKNFAIKKGDNEYRFVDIEFYYYNPNIDDYRDDKEEKKVTYGRNCPAGKWFYHNSGIDLTFDSDAAKNYGGGILIRGIKNADKVVEGPKNCYYELYETTEDAFTPSAPYIVPATHIDCAVKTSTRYGLTVIIDCGGSL